MLDALELIPSLLRDTVFCTKRMCAAIDSTMYATDEAVRLAAEGATFRDAYHAVTENMSALREREPAKSLKARISLGGPGRLELDALELNVKNMKHRLCES